MLDSTGHGKDIDASFLQALQSSVYKHDGVENVAALESFMSRLGYELTSSGRRWARQKLLKGHSLVECVVEIVHATLARDVHDALLDEEKLAAIGQYTAAMLWMLKRLRDDGYLTTAEWRSAAASLSSIGLASDEQIEIVERVLRQEAIAERRLAVSHGY